jgi:hypothetical protein
MALRQGDSVTAVVNATEVPPVDSTDSQAVAPFATPDARRIIAPERVLYRRLQLGGCAEPEPRRQAGPTRRK